MNNRRIVAGRVRDLEQRANELRKQAGSSFGSDDDDNLWMSSLEIIGELLGVVQQVVEGREGTSDKMQLACPNCRSLVAVSYDAVADAATTCPACGAIVLLANPT